MEVIWNYTTPLERPWVPLSCTSHTHQCTSNMYLLFGNWLKIKCWNISKLNSWNMSYCLWLDRLSAYLLLLLCEPRFRRNHQSHASLRMPAEAGGSVSWVAPQSLLALPEQLAASQAQQAESDSRSDPVDELLRLPWQGGEYCWSCRWWWLVVVVLVVEWCWWCDFGCSKWSKWSWGLGRWWCWWWWCTVDDILLLMFRGGGTFGGSRGTSFSSSSSKPASSAVANGGPRPWVHKRRGVSLVTIIADALAVVVVIVVVDSFGGLTDLRRCCRWIVQQQQQQQLLCFGCFLTTDVEHRQLLRFNRFCLAVSSSRELPIHRYERTPDGTKHARDEKHVGLQFAIFDAEEELEER